MSNLIGFIVEGQGEFNCYPSLFNKINEVSGCYTPIVNAGGCGSLYKNLPEHLTDLCKLHSPTNVIVTVDLIDLLKQELAISCEDAVDTLSRTIAVWRENATSDSRIDQIPDTIVAVLQIQKFESWLISDTEGLKNKCLVNTDVENVSDSDAIENPEKWFSDNLIEYGTAKNINFARKLTAAIQPCRMRQNSRSFDKFYRECVRHFQPNL